MEHQIVVGNIGSVYVGDVRKRAGEIFKLYVGYSKDFVGRAAGEAVTWVVNGEMYKEYFPPEENE